MFNVKDSTSRLDTGASALKGLKHWLVDLGDLTATAIAQDYEVDLEEMTTSAATLDWIMQITEKTWATPSLIAEFIEIVREVIDPQATLCGFGIERGPIDVKALVQRRAKPGARRRADA
jgi:hypothetical protein